MPAIVGGLSIQTRHLVKRGKQDNCSAVGIRRLLALLSFGAELVWNQVSTSTAETRLEICGMWCLCAGRGSRLLCRHCRKQPHTRSIIVPMARARFILGFIPGSHKLPMKRACKSLRGSKACWLLAGQDQLARFLSTSWRSKHDVLQGRVIHLKLNATQPLFLG